MKPERNTFLRGFFTVMLLHILQIVFLTGPSLFLVGVTQLLYVVPIAWWAYKRHDTRRLQGIITAAGITIVVNVLCYLLVWYVGINAIGKYT